MPRLKNPNHEKMAREYARQALKNEGRVVKADVYQTVYREASYNTARTEAPQLLAKPNVQARIQEIISLKNPAEEISIDLMNLRKANKEIVDKEGNIHEVKDNATRLGAVNTCVKVLGGFGNDGSTIDARSVHFNMNNGTGILFDSMLKKLDTLCNGIMSVDQPSQSIDITNTSQDQSTP